MNGRTDGRTDDWTDGRVDRPSYRDARRHLKSYSNSFKYDQWPRVSNSICTSAVVLG